MTKDLSIILLREGQAIRYDVRIEVDRSFLKRGWFRGAVKVRRHEAIEAVGITDVKERHGSRSLMARNSTERLGGEYDLESRGSAFSCASEKESIYQLPKHLQINVVLCWF